MARRRKKSHGGLWFLLLIALIAGGVGIYYAFPGMFRAEPGPEEALAHQPTGETENAGEGTSNGTPAKADSNGNSAKNPKGKLPTTAPAQPSAKLSAPMATNAFNEGLKLQSEGKLVAARTLLSQALVSGHLNSRQAKQSREALQDLAERTIFSKRVYPDDPYCFEYRVKPGEILAGKKGIIRRMNLRIPYQTILEINRIGADRSIQAGQKIKLVRGPFHAVVDKSDCLMDIYLHDIFIQRIPVGIGKRDTPTPVGFFRIGWGKRERAPYTPPISSGKPMQKILPGQEGYPFEPGGRWIPLEGIEAAGTDVRESDGYGIHGTNEPESIGKPSSLGCVRLSDAGIAEVFKLLYVQHSTVQIKE
ncbi:MAG: L,D-transpeptidase family protein [Phycisphaerae bacterium]